MVLVAEENSEVFEGLWAFVESEGPRAVVGMEGSSYMVLFLG